MTSPCHRTPNRRLRLPLGFHTLSASLNASALTRALVYRQSDPCSRDQARYRETGEEKRDTSVVQVSVAAWAAEAHRDTEGDCGRTQVCGGHRSSLPRAGVEPCEPCPGLSAFPRARASIGGEWLLPHGSTFCVLGANRASSIQGDLQRAHSQIEWKRGASSACVHIIPSILMPWHGTLP